jgi:type III pantothenate kinase
MTLLLDAGTQWLKWAWLEGGAAGRSERVTYDAADPLAWQRALDALAAPRRVVVANVAGPRFAHLLASYTRRAWQIEPEFPAATRSALGLRNACAEPRELAIDRWLGLLAAWRQVRAPLIVASARAAYAVDLVDGDGQHRGGCMVPGARIMREALHTQTAGIRAPSLADAAATSGVFGINTAGGVQQGARLALAALTDRLAATFAAAIGREARVFVTGGAGPEIAALMRHPQQQQPDLVLEGLALTLQQALP